MRLRPGVHPAKARRIADNVNKMSELVRNEAVRLRVTTLQLLGFANACLASSSEKHLWVSFSDHSQASEAFAMFLAASRFV
jgi:hypothetical protein